MTSTLTSLDEFSGPSAAAPAPAPQPTPAARPAAKAKDSDLDAKAVRKIAQTTVDIDKASAPRREMLASLLGLRKGADTVSLVVAIASGAANVAPITALLNIAEQADPMEAVVTAVQLVGEESLAKSVWSLLGTLGAVSGGIPAASAKAGGAIAKAAKALDERSVAELAEVRNLLR